MNLEALAAWDCELDLSKVIWPERVANCPL
jgi:hypothetical protein